MGVALRLSRYDEALFGDELSTLFLVRGSLADTVEAVSSDAEISPPLYFILAWLTTNLGSPPELVRLPALIFGVAAIPLTYAVGARAVGRGAGLIAAAVMALSPFMIFYSTDGRVYTLAISLLLVSTLAMLVAAEGGGRRWWAVYAVASCLAMYAHYTSAFVLIAQLGWLAWAHREAIGAALMANVAAALTYVPWIPSAVADTRSPTIDILEALQGSGLEVKLEAVLTWGFGYPFVGLGQVPGRFLVILAVAALAGAVAVGSMRHLQGRASWRSPSPGMVLVLAIGLATPLAETALLLIAGSDLLGARNLNTSSGGLALSIGAVLAAAGPVVGSVCALAVLATFGIGAARTLEPESTVIAFDRAGAFVDAEARPGDIVVDAVSALVTPVPLTPLQLYAERDADYEPFLPLGAPPFLPFQSQPPPAEELLKQAFAEAEADGGRVLVLAGRRGVNDEAITLRPLSPTEPTVRFPLPVGWHLSESATYPGIVDLRVGVIEPPP